MNGSGRGSVIGEFDPCELEEDLANNSSSNGTALDSTSDSSTTATTTTLPLDMDVEATSHGVVTAATLKQQTSIKQNGTSRAMSIVHSYNYTGERRQGQVLLCSVNTIVCGLSGSTGRQIARKSKY